MRYFPMFYDSREKKILIIGGGTVAFQKLSVLNSFEFEITVIGQKIDKKIRNICTKKGYKLFERSFEDFDIEGFDIVIAATDDSELQKRVYSLKKNGMMINTVDLPQACDFIFGSVFEKEGVLVALSTQSKAPSIAKALKDRLREAIPKGLSKLVAKIEAIRNLEAPGEQRMKKIKRLAAKWFEKR